MSAERELLKKKQDAAQRVYDRMLEALLGLTPARDLRVADVQFIAEWARTIAFDAMKEVE